MAMMAMHVTPKKGVHLNGSSSSSSSTKKNLRPSSIQSSSDLFRALQNECVFEEFHVKRYVERMESLFNRWNGLAKDAQKEIDRIRSRVSNEVIQGFHEIKTDLDEWAREWNEIERKRHMRKGGMVPRNLPAIAESHLKSQESLLNGSKIDAHSFCPSHSACKSSKSNHLKSPSTSSADDENTGSNNRQLISLFSDLTASSPKKKATKTSPSKMDVDSFGSPARKGGLRIQKKSSSKKSTPTKKKKRDTRTDKTYADKLLVDTDLRAWECWQVASQHVSFVDILKKRQAEEETRINGLSPHSKKKALADLQRSKENTSMNHSIDLNQDGSMKIDSILNGPFHVRIYDPDGPLFELRDRRNSRYSFRQVRKKVSAKWMDEDDSGTDSDATTSEESGSEYRIDLDAAEAAEKERHARSGGGGGGSSSSDGGTATESEILPNGARISDVTMTDASAYTTNDDTAMTSMDDANPIKTEPALSALIRRKGNGRSGNAFATLMSASAKKKGKKSRNSKKKKKSKRAATAKKATKKKEKRSRHPNETDSQRKERRRKRKVRKEKRELKRKQKKMKREKSEALKRSQTGRRKRKRRGSTNPRASAESERVAREQAPTLEDPANGEIYCVVNGTSYRGRPLGLIPEERHLRNHFKCLCLKKKKGSKEKEECGKILLSRGSWRAHVRLHSGEKPFKCFWDGCTMVFANPSSRNAHVKNIHNREALPYKCTDCDKRFLAPSAVQIHRVTFHGVTASHVCPKCDKKFPYEHTWLNHLKSAHPNMDFNMIDLTAINAERERQGLQRLRLFSDRERIARGLMPERVPGKRGRKARPKAGTMKREPGIRTERDAQDAMVIAKNLGLSTQDIDRVDEMGREAVSFEKARLAEEQRKMAEEKENEKSSENTNGTTMTMDVDDAIPLNTAESPLRMPSLEPN